MYRLVAAAGILFCLLGPPVSAAEQEQPSLELLEFLGDWAMGDDGWLDPIEFEEMAFGLKTINEISKPFKTDFGWHIVKLYKKTPLAPFEEMQFDLGARVKRDARSKLINSSLLKTLKKKYNIQDTNSELAYFETIINLLF